MRQRKRSASDFSSEVRAHIELEADRLREEGLGEDEAYAQARKAFGNVTHAEECFYESSVLLWLDHLRQDLSYALRQLQENKALCPSRLRRWRLALGRTRLFLRYFMR